MGTHNNRFMPFVRDYPGEPVPVGKQTSKGYIIHVVPTSTNESSAHHSSEPTRGPSRGGGGDIMNV